MVSNKMLLWLGIALIVLLIFGCGKTASTAVVVYEGVRSEKNIVNKISRDSREEAKVIVDAFNDTESVDWDIALAPEYILKFKN